MAARLTGRFAAWRTGAGGSISAPKEKTGRENEMAERNPRTQMPRWLLYGLIGKGVLIVVIVLAVLYYAGIF